MPVPVSVLGYVITAEGVCMEEGKVQAVLDLPPPKIIKEVLRFLGFANYYRRFIRNFSMVIAPLTPPPKGCSTPSIPSPMARWRDLIRSSCCICVVTAQTARAIGVGTYPGLNMLKTVWSTHLLDSHFPVLPGVSTTIVSMDPGMGRYASSRGVVLLERRSLGVISCASGGSLQMAEDPTQGSSRLQARRESLTIHQGPELWLALQEVVSTFHRSFQDHSQG